MGRLKKGPVTRDGIYKRPLIEGAQTCNALQGGSQDLFFGITSTVFGGPLQGWGVKVARAARKFCVLGGFLSPTFVLISCSFLYNMHSLQLDLKLSSGVIASSLEKKKNKENRKQKKQALWVSNPYHYKSTAEKKSADHYNGGGGRSRTPL